MTRTFLKSLLATVAGAAIVMAPKASAYYSVLDNNEILSKGNYKITTNAQFITEGGGGANVAARFDMGLDEEFGVRGIFGVGQTDFFAGGMVRWVPIPDIDNQPAVGFNAGVLYGKDEDVRDLTVRIEPIASKKFNVSETIFTPYVSLPLGVRFQDTDVEDDTNVTWQLVVGSQLQIPDLQKIHFIGEIGLDLTKAPTYVNIGALLYFDEENGIIFE